MNLDVTAEYPACAGGAQARGVKFLNRDTDNTVRLFCLLAIKARKPRFAWWQKRGRRFGWPRRVADTAGENVRDKGRKLFFGKGVSLRNRTSSQSGYLAATGEGQRWFTPMSLSVAADGMVCKRTIIRKCEDGTVSSVKTPGGHYRISQEEGRKFLSGLKERGVKNAE